MLVTARDHLRGEGSWGEEGGKPAQVCPYFLYFITTKERETSTRRTRCFHAEALPTLLGRVNPSQRGSWKEARVWRAPLGIKQPEAPLS